MGLLMNVRKGWKILMKCRGKQSVKQTIFLGLCLVSIFLYVVVAQMMNQDHQLKPQTSQTPVDQVDDVGMALLQIRRKTLWNSEIDMLKNQILPCRTNYRQVSYPRTRKKKTIRLPDVIGIGMEHCGINALIDLLLPHPSVRLSTDGNGSVPFFNLQNDAHIDKYLKSLPEVEEDAFLVEKNSGGFHLPPYNLPYFMKKMFPNAKLLLLLCEPTERVLNEFTAERTVFNMSTKNPVMEKYQSIEQFLDEFLPFIKREIGDYKRVWRNTDAEHKLFEMLQVQKTYNLSSILTKSFYALHLKRWRNIFGKSSLMVVDDQELYENPGLLIEKIQDFVGMPMLLLREDYVQNYSSKTYCYKNWMNNELNTKHCLPQKNTNRSETFDHESQSLKNLKHLYKSHNEELFKMLGKTFHW